MKRISMLAFLFCCSVYSTWLRVEQLLLSRGNSRLWIYTRCNFLNENKIRGLKWLRAIKLNTVMYLIGQKVTISKSNWNVYFHWIVLRLQVISIFWPKTSSIRFTRQRDTSELVKKWIARVVHELELAAYIQSFALQELIESYALVTNL